MNHIDQAILQDEIRQAINALFKTGQVGREENAALLDVVGNGEHFDNPGWANFIDGSPVPFTPEVGKEYSVTLTTPSGTATFKTVASELDGIAVIGNPALMGAPNDTGEIFACATLNNQFFCVWDVINFEPNEVRVQIKSETIHPIDPKFLPGVCLPVVEIADVENLTADENAKLTACIGLPCIIKVTVDGVTVCTVAAYQTANGVHNFTFSLLGATASYESTDGITWSAKS